MSEDQRLHLQFVQNVITRMNSNSFQIKTWTITLIAALLALAVNSKNHGYVLTACLPTFVFWLLDSYYLQQEKKFRGIYNDIVEGKISCYKMPLDNYHGSSDSCVNAAFSKTVILFYLVVFICIFIFSRVM